MLTAIAQERRRQRDRERYARNPAIRIRRAKEWIKRNPEKAKEYGARSRERHREQIRIDSAQRRQENREAIRVYQNEWTKALRQEVLDHYGRTCVCCGETIERFLSIDHVNGGGNAHRKSMGGTPLSRPNLYAWLKRNGFPPGFQTQCFNCNLGRALNGGICPHKDEKKNPHLSVDFEDVLFFRKT